MQSRTERFYPRTSRFIVWKCVFGRCRYFARELALVNGEMSILKKESFTQFAYTLVSLRPHFTCPAKTSRKLKCQLVCRDAPQRARVLWQSRSNTVNFSWQIKPTYRELMDPLKFNKPPGVLQLTKTPPGVLQTHMYASIQND
jgi:hypothetical protein